MNETEIKEKIQTALRTVQGLGDPYQPIAFEEVLRSLLAADTTSVKASRGQKPLRPCLSMNSWPQEAARLSGTTPCASSTGPMKAG